MESNCLSRYIPTDGWILEVAGRMRPERTGRVERFLDVMVMEQGATRKLARTKQEEESYE